MLQKCVGTENAVGIVQWICAEANQTERDLYITGEAVLSPQGEPWQRFYNSGSEFQCNSQSLHQTPLKPFLTTETSRFTQANNSKAGI